jgi:hypothetical protein
LRAHAIAIGPDVAHDAERLVIPQCLKHSVDYFRM